MASSGKGGAAVENMVGMDTLELCKRSLIFSVGCICLPGIIYNINKWRQLKCMKGVCYRDYTAAGIMTMKDCERQYWYDNCVFIWGQFTAALFPLENLLKLVADAIKNPLAFGSQIGWELAKKPLKKSCSQVQESKTEVSLGSITCIPYGIMLVTEAVMSFQQQTESLRTLQWTGADVDYCDALFNPDVKQDEGS